jgi:Ran GTPase-activating protein (RanGAP) involved in mRNA processing and transport/energy-coupling factor transporter ATP-binding protein EcfA2
MPLEQSIIQQITTNSVTTLCLNNKQIGDAAIKELAEALKDNHSITTLYLAGNQIGVARAKDLAEVLKINHSIINLHLGNNQIGDAGAKDIAEALKINKSITTLYLFGNQIGDAGAKDIAEALKINKSITTLYLGQNQIGDAGAKELAQALKDNHSITALYLNNNQIGDAGAKYLAEALKFNYTITNLNLQNNQIGDAVAKEIATELQINKDPTKKAAKILKQQQQAEAAEKARQEAEKLEQEEKFKEQEEARLKAIEEAEVKEYIPNIPVVKLFEVAGGDNQFDNDNQATIKEVSELIREGNDRLQEHGKKGILLLGNTGAGKSTLAHLLSGIELQAIRDNATNKLVIDAMYPLENIAIGHKMTSETKIPNKCFAKDLIIWDCPGFNDTDPVQEIANSFYIKRLFETTDQLKFVLVVDESNLSSNRGSIFLETLYNFIKSFKDIESVEGISLVVTHVEKGTNIQHIINSIDAILRDNQILKYNPKATKKCKELITKLKDGNSIHLFHRPDKEGELTVPDLLAEIEKSPEYSDAKGDMVNIAISKKAMECSSHLLNTASNNFNQLLEVIVKAIADATNCSNVNPFNAFSENYAIVKDLVPSSINYNELKKHSEGEYFPELELLSRLQKVLNYNQIVSISDALMILQIAVELFAEYAESDNSPLQNQIQDYGYCLQQQYEYVKFFANVCGVELPDHTKIAELITACHAKVTENLEYQVSSLKIDEEQSDLGYYSKAIEYLENYKDSPTCKTLKAIAYSCMASISEQNGAKESPLAYYVKAIEADSHLPKIYEKLGQLFFNNGKYAKAIDCYKVVNNEFMIKTCFKKWLKQDQNNPDIMLKQAEYFESIGLFEKAKTYYHHAFSLNQDKNFRSEVYKKLVKL